MSQAIKTITLHARGITPLVMANGQMADPENEFAAAIAEITSKRPITAEDRRRKELLQWRGHVYTGENDRIIIPAQNLNRCLQNAGKAFKAGKAVERGVLLPDIEYPVEYEGPRDLAKLVLADRYTLRAVANLNPTRGTRGGKGTKVWPRFYTWAFSATINLILDAIDPAQFAKIAELAGSGEGICDGRRLGFGRFEVTLS